MSEKRGKFTKGSTASEDIRGELYYAIEDLLAQGIDIRSNSLYRDRDNNTDETGSSLKYKKGSPHGHASACDISHNHNPELMTFLFGTQYNPDTFKADSMKDWVLTPKATEWAKKHNILILDEYEIGLGHIHFEVQTRDGNSEAGFGETEIVSEYGEDFSSRKKFTNGSGKYLKAHYWGADSKTFVENDYNTSEFYTENVGVKEYETEREDRLGHPTNIITVDNLNKEGGGELAKVYNESSVSNTETTVEETTSPKLQYKVQVGVFEANVNEKTQSLFNNLRENEGYAVIKELDKGKLYKYSMYKVEDGIPTTKAEADKLQKELRNFGFEEAFTLAEKDGERIRMEDAEKLESSIRIDNVANTGGVNYRVKVGVFEENVNEETQALFDKIEESGEYVIKKELDKGILYSYIAERKDGANTLEDAESIKKAMNDAGITDVFIYAEDKSGNRIKMEEALEAQKKYDEKNPKNKKKEEVRPNNMPPNVDNPTKEMLDSAVEYGTAKEALEAFNNGDIQDGDIIKIGNEHVQVSENNGYPSITPYREDNNTFDGGEGGTQDLGLVADEEVINEEETEEIEEEVEENIEEEVEEEIEEETEDPLRTEIEDTSEITTEPVDVDDNNNTQVVEETTERTTTLTEEEQDILDNYSIDGTVGEGKAEIKNNEGETIAYLEGNKLIGKKVVPFFGEQTFEIGEYVDNEDGTYTFKEGKDYNKVMTAASSEEKKVIETFKKAAEDNPQFARDIISTTEGNETNMSGSDIRTSATTFTPSSEDDIVEDDTEENLEDLEIEEEFAEPRNINDDKETIRNRLLQENPSLADDLEKLEDRVEYEYEGNQWDLEEIQELKDNKKYIDKIFEQNPEIAAKYEGIPIEEYNKVDGFYDDLSAKIDEEIEIDEENQEKTNKEETGVIETNEQRTKREADTVRFNELEEKKNNNTITPEEQTELTELKTEYGGFDLNEIHEINKTEQAEKDVNIEAGKGDVTNEEFERQKIDKEIEEEDLESEREENFRLYGKKETDEEKYTRIEDEKDKNEEKGLGRITNVQAEDENVIFSTPNSEKALRNELKTNLKNKENALKAAESEEEKSQIDKDIKTTNLALEYLELKKEYGNKDDVFDINTFREAVENNDNQQISMYYNDQRGTVINKLESQRRSIVDGSFEGTEKEKTTILSTLEKLNTSTQKSELPEFDSEYDKLLYMTNATNEDIDKLKALQKDRKYIQDNGKVNIQIIDLANQDVANSGVTDTDMTGNNNYVVVHNPKDGTNKWVLRDWVNSFDDNTSQIEELEKKESKGTITSEESVTLKNYKANRFHSRDILTNTDIYTGTQGHPDGAAGRYFGGTDEIDLFLENRKKKIFETGANPDINLTPEQIAKFDEINSEDYDMSNLENDLDQIVSYNPEAFEFNTDLESVTDQEPRSMGPTAQELLKGTMDVANGIMDSFGGPDALINAVMGKKALSAAMKDVTPMEQAKLSPIFQEHLRETKELSKRGYHPSEELKIRRGIDKAYQQGLENSIRGTAGDRAKYLASSGIFDAQRTSALLEVSAQDAALQRENQKQYSELLVYKENFDAKQQEAKRTENLQMQLANKKAASEFAGLTFANALSSMKGSNSLLDQIKNGLANTNSGYKLTSIYDDNTNLNENE